MNKSNRALMNRLISCNALLESVAIGLVAHPPVYSVTDGMPASRKCVCCGATAWGKWDRGVCEVGLLKHDKNCPYKMAVESRAVLSLQDHLEQLSWEGERIR